MVTWFIDVHPHERLFKKKKFNLPVQLTSYLVMVITCSTMIRTIPYPLLQYNLKWGPTPDYITASSAHVLLLYSTVGRWTDVCAPH